MAAHGLGDATILGLSDVGEDDTLTDTLVQMFPDTFGPKVITFTTVISDYYK